MLLQAAFLDILNRQSLSLGARTMIEALCVSDCEFPRLKKKRWRVLGDWLVAADPCLALICRPQNGMWSKLSSSTSLQLFLGVAISLGPVLSIDLASKRFLTGQVLQYFAAVPNWVAGVWSYWLRLPAGLTGSAIMQAILHAHKLALWTVKSYSVMLFLAHLHVILTHV